MRSDRYPGWLCVAFAMAWFLAFLPVAALLLRGLLVALVSRGYLGAGIPDIVVPLVATTVAVLIAYLPARGIYSLMRGRPHRVERTAVPTCRVCGCDLSEDLMARRCPACGTVLAREES